ncbi:hypothetical protein CXB51_025118 [Gossypium anomalum]|uniref:Prefoldin subunit 2 n=4 Tax=Gossypium TaxID=3633 RepID=A0A8J6CQ19_9ROSI|nr:hypothetical protein CXB51_025118 [Gossypium anomalum]
MLIDLIYAIRIIVYKFSNCIAPFNLGFQIPCPFIYVAAANFLILDFYLQSIAIISIVLPTTMNILPIALFSVIIPFVCREKMASKSEGKEPVNEQVVANMYGAMRSELNQIYSKITELEMEVSEHSLVINAIQPLDQSRRCYRMIGGVLVERTIKEVLPAVQRNKEGLEEVIARLNETLEKKKKEIADFETKYKIRIKKSDNDSKDESNKKEGSAQGVLVGPASSSQ